MEGKALNQDGTPINAGFYHRWFTMGKDAMGSSSQHRGYNDDNMFVALNTQEKVASVEFKKCVGKPKKCYQLRQKWSYAIPLELIYMTPLYKWNPFNLKHHGDQNKDNLKIINGGGKRNGDCNGGAAKAFNGINSRLFYQTPASFYSGSVSGSTAADTARGVTCVLNQDGESKKVRAAGTHVFLPQIKNVGILRTRYPIFPVHGEGSSVWKELNAVREVTMNSETWSRMFWKNADLELGSVDLEMEMGYSKTTRTSRHTHTVIFSPEEEQMLKGNNQLAVTSSQANGHTHQLIVRYRWWDKKYQFVKCDGDKDCWDQHARIFTKVSS